MSSPWEIEKRPWDRQLIEIDCSPIIPPGVTISTVVSVTCDNGGVVLDGVYHSDRSVFAMASGGDTPTGGVPIRCVCRARVNLSEGGQRKEATFTIVLWDRPEPYPGQ